MTFTLASTLEEALEALAEGARPVAGGSDLVVGARQGKVALPADIVAIDRVAELAGIEATADGLRIGATVTHAQLMSEPHVLEGYTGLADAAALIGSPATRNVGTIGGNVMNGSPAMDTGAPLLVLGAVAELRSADGGRLVPLDELWSGPGETTAASDELCVALHLPARSERSGSAYLRLEYRRAMEIAVVGAAAAVELAEDGLVAAGTVALTAVAPTIVALDGLDLAGRSPADAAAAAEAAAVDQAAPISDVRATDRYRRHTVGVMARRAVATAAARAAGENIAVPANHASGVGASL